MNIKRSFALLILIAAAASVGAAVESLRDLGPKLVADKEEIRTPALRELQGFLTAACKPGAEAERAAFAKLLVDAIADTATPQPARILFLRQLEYAGAGESVPTLTTLLDSTDAETRECARRALEKNSDASAGASLREALGKATDANWKIGLVNSLGHRRDSKAVKAIQACLNDSALAQTALLALSRIADTDAVNALLTAFEQKAPFAAEALIDAANRCLDEGKASLAKPVFKSVYADGSSPAVKAAALNGLAKADPASARKLVVEALSSSEPQIQFAAIASAPGAFGNEITATLTPLLSKLTPAIKARALGLLDASAEKTVIDAAKDSQENVRLAAIESLGRIGGADSVPALLAAFASESRPAKAASESALAAIHGNGVNQALAGFAASGEAKVRAAAITALAIRNETSVVSSLLRYASETDAAIVKAACGALRILGGESETEPLAKLYAANPSTDALNALQAVAGRSKDKASASGKLLDLAKNAEPKTVAGFLTVVGVLGDSASVEALVKYAGHANEEIANAAVRALGNWPNFGASKQLLQIATSADFKPAQQSMALQGLARLIESADTEMPQARLDVSLAALKAASKAEDKKQLLSALGTVPDAKAAEPILEALNDPALKSEAAFAGAALAEALVRTDKAAAQQLARKVKEANISRELNRKADSVLRR